jgi:phosphoribosylformylglycinamidine synthase I
VKWGVLHFPGSNDERDTIYALESVLGYDARLLWHGDRDLNGCDAIVLPGGFSYGDYLRCGAMARFSPVMESVAKFAQDGGPVLGICNGFQVLCEAGLLPGAMVRNRDLKFLCRRVTLTVENADTAFSRALSVADRIEIPIKNGEGCYVADERTLAEITENGQVVFRYAANPNGSLGDIAGVTNTGGNVVGLMPHPEHAVDPLTGGTDGQALFRSVGEWRQAA